MAYKIKPGITMIQVCGQHMLVASRSLWKEHPRVRPVPKSWAVCWALMENGKTDEEVMSDFMKLFKKTEEEITSRFGKIFQKMFEEGYLIDDSDEVLS